MAVSRLLLKYIVKDISVIADKTPRYMNRAVIQMRRLKNSNLLKIHQRTDYQPFRLKSSHTSILSKMPQP